MASAEDKSVAKQLNVTEKSIANFIQQLESFLDSSITQVVKDIQSGNLDTIEVAARLNGLVGALNELGLQSVFNNIAEIYGGELAFIQESFEKSAGENVALSAIDVDVAEQLIAFNTEALFSRVETYVSDVKNVIFSQVVAGQRPDISGIKDTLTPRLAANIETELNTSLAGFQRSVTLNKAADFGVELFAYVGGLIKSSRDFCIERDGGVFTLAEIKSWDNGQGLPADIYLGGYNCRHRLIAVSEVRARALGYTG
ncbi:MAG: hypothetical protein KC483_10190 [Nitrosarchaeum sp.]|nr:hypothetical protein [Nitrosarchaeum sp.]